MRIAFFAAVWSLLVVGISCSPAAEWTSPADHPAVADPVDFDPEYPRGCASFRLRAMGASSTV